MSNLIRIFSAGSKTYYTFKREKGVHCLNYVINRDNAEIKYLSRPSAYFFWRQELGNTFVVAFVLLEMY